MLAKLIPIAIIGILGIKGLSLAKDQMAFLSNYTQIATTQHEVSNIKKLLMVELASDGVVPQNWEEIVRSQVNAKGRDPVVDVWGNYYGVWEEDDITVGSAGPDSSFSTEDDILTKN
jgi:hypothetical protein